MAGAGSNADGYIRSCKALHHVIHRSILCVDSVLKNWHAIKQQTLPPCSHPRPRPQSNPQVCSESGKPKSPASCPNCVAWGKAVEDTYYPQWAKGRMAWCNVNPICLPTSHVEVSKAFVIRLQDLQQYNQLDNFDPASLLMIMMKFKEFHQGDRTKFDIIREVSDIRNRLCHMQLQDNLHLDDQQVDDIFSDINDLVSCLETSHPQWFSSQYAFDTRTQLDEIKRGPVTAQMKEILNEFSKSMEEVVQQAMHEEQKDFYQKLSQEVQQVHSVVQNQLVQKVEQLNASTKQEWREMRQSIRDGHAKTRQEQRSLHQTLTQEVQRETAVVQEQLNTTTTKLSTKMHQSIHDRHAATRQEHRNLHQTLTQEVQQGTAVVQELTRQASVEICQTIHKEHIETRQEQKAFATQIQYSKETSNSEQCTSSDIAHQFDLQICKQELITFYKYEMCRVQLLPWCDDTRNMDDIYVSLELEKKTKKGISLLTNNEQLVTLQTLQKMPATRVLVKGLAGSGKSTLLTKLAYSWSQQKDESLLANFELVFILSLREVQRGCSLIKAIFHQILADDTNVSKDGLKRYIESHPSKVLILMDGFDEYVAKGNLSNDLEGNIERILFFKLLRECRIILSTRPYEHLGQHQSHYVSVILKGFSPRNVKVYMNKFFDGNTKMVEELSNRLGESKVISSLSTIPVILMLLCLLWEEEQQLPNNQSDERQLLYTQSEEQQLPNTQSDEQQLPNTQADERQLPNTQSDERQLLYTQSEELQLPSTQSVEQQLPNTQVDERQLPNTQSDEQQLPYTQSEEQQLPNTQSDEQQLLKTQADERQLPNTQSDERQLLYTQSEELQLPNTQSDERQLPNTQADERQFPNTQSDEGQLLYTHAEELQLPNTQADERQLPNTQSDEQWLPYNQSEEQQLPNTQSDERQLPNTQSDEQQLPNTQADEQLLLSTQSDEQQLPNTQAHKRQLPNTQSELYQEFVLFLWRKYYDRYKEHTNFDDEKAQEVINKDIPSFGKVALEGLLPKKCPSEEKLVFSEMDFGDSLFLLGCHTGLLTRERLRAKWNTCSAVTFLHKSFQEFCAAKTWASLIDIDHEQFNDILSQVKTWSMFLRKIEMIKFCCGLVGAVGAVSVIDHAIAMVKQNLSRSSIDIGFGDESDILPILNLLYESQIIGNDDLTKSLKSIFSRHVHTLKVVCNHSQALSIFHHFVKSEFGLPSLATIRTLTFVEHAHDSLDVITDTIAHSPNVKHISITFKKDGKSIMNQHNINCFCDRIVTVFPKISSISVAGSSGGPLFINSSPLSFNINFKQAMPNMTLIGLLLPKLKNLKSLEMKGIDITPEDVASVFKVLQSQIVQLELHSIAVAKAIVHIRQIITPQLNELYLVNAKLKEDDIDVLCEFIHHASNLKELVLCYNTIGMAVVPLVEQLQHCIKMKSLGLSSTSITNTGVIEVAQRFAFLSNLENLYIKHNDTVNTGLDAVFKNIHHLPKLRLLETSATVDNQCSNLVRDCLVAMGKVIPEQAEHIHVKICEDQMKTVCSAAQKHL